MDVKLKKNSGIISSSDNKKLMLSKPAKNNSSRLLISVNVLGSVGPLRFIVNKDDRVSEVIEAALKMYGREKRLPLLLPSHLNYIFLLYPSPDAGFDALSPTESIGSKGVRNFVLCKKERRPQMSEGTSERFSQIKKIRNVGGWKAWIIKSFSFKF